MSGETGFRAPVLCQNSDSHDIPKRRTTALGDVANTDTKLLICSLFSKEPSFGTGRGTPLEKNALTSFSGVVLILMSASSSAFDGW